MPEALQSNEGDFHQLTPEIVIDLAERALGRRFSSLCRSLNSYINRVFELQLDDGAGVIAKFYRPGRWSTVALEDEHEFLLELAEREIPVIPPMTLVDSSTLGTTGRMHFALFQKKLGRGIDEPDVEGWEMLGRLLARVHAIGALHPPRDRIVLSPDRSTTANIDMIISGGFIPRDLVREYEDITRAIVELARPLFKDIEMIRIHGDCHQANIVYRPGEAYYLIDFDDMAIGPPVHDFWMLLPGYSRESRGEIEMFLEGYTTFRDFDRRMLKLIEPLRAMRFIHFTAWCAMQARDGGFARLAPDWGLPTYWRREIEDLRQQRGEIIASLEERGDGPLFDE